MWGENPSVAILDSLEVKTRNREDISPEKRAEMIAAIERIRNEGASLKTLFQCLDAIRCFNPQAEQSIREHFAQDMLSAIARWETLPPTVSSPGQQKALQSFQKEGDVAWEAVHTGLFGVPEEAYELEQRFRTQSEALKHIIDNMDMYAQQNGIAGDEMYRWVRDDLQKKWEICRDEWTWWLEKAWAFIRGMKNGAIDLATGIFDMTKFVVKYSSDSEYRDLVWAHWEQIRQAVEQYGWSVSFAQDLFQQEMARQSKMSAADKAEAAGRMYSTILAGMGIGAVASKLSNASSVPIRAVQGAVKLRNFGEKATRFATQETARLVACRIGAFILNGPAESTLGGIVTASGKNIAQVIRATAEVLQSGESSVKKLQSSWNTLAQIEISMKTANPEQLVYLSQARTAIHDEEDRLHAEIVRRAESHRNGVGRETVFWNAALDPSARVLKARELIGRELSDPQKDAILHVHNNISRGVYANDTKSLSEMVRALSDAGFLKEEREILIRNGVLWSDTHTARKMSDMEFDQSVTDAKKLAEIDQTSLYSNTEHPIDPLRAKDLFEEQIRSIRTVFWSPGAPRSTTVFHREVDGQMLISKRFGQWLDTRLKNYDVLTRYLESIANDYRKIDTPYSPRRALMRADERMKELGTALKELAQSISRDTLLLQNVGPEYARSILDLIGRLEAVNSKYQIILHP